MTGPGVLVVGDDRATALVLSRLLQKAGYRVATALEAAQGVMQAHRERPAVIVTDI